MSIKDGIIWDSVPVSLGMMSGTESFEEFSSVNSSTSSSMEESVVNVLSGLSTGNPETNRIFTELVCVCEVLEDCFGSSTRLPLPLHLPALGIAVPFGGSH